MHKSGLICISALYVDIVSHVPCSSGEACCSIQNKKAKIGNSTSSDLLRGERKRAERAVVKNDTVIQFRVQSQFLIGPSLPYRHLWLNCLNKSSWSSAAQIWSDGSCSITYWRGHVKFSPVTEPNPKNNIHLHMLWSASTLARLHKSFRLTPGK